MRVLILCTGNSARSQMAEALLRSFDSRIEAFSAGAEPAERVNPFAIRAMAEAGIDLVGAEPKHVDQFLRQPFDYVVTVCDHAAEVCPAFLGAVRERRHLSFPDPAAAEGDDERKLAVFRESRDAIRERFRDFYEQELRPQLERS